MELLKGYSPLYIPGPSSHAPSPDFLHSPPTWCVHTCKCLLPTPLPKGSQSDLSKTYQFLAFVSIEICTDLLTNSQSSKGTHNPPISLFIPLQLTDACSAPSLCPSTTLPPSSCGDPSRRLPPSTGDSHCWEDPLPLLHLPTPVTPTYS